ncbi:hypothetical protein Bbelb_010790 [Branchiostoma belcheri]|nr:hypothetical protein Bbelb_010790 [Branchiostoma belcheri]
MLVRRTISGLLRLADHAAANRALRISQLKQQGIFRQATSAAAQGSSSDVPPIDELLPRLKNSSLVIFDKDGTLICFHSMWAPWAHQFVERLEADTQLSIRDKVYHLLGFDTQTQRFRPGLLAEATMFIIKERMVELLEKEGLESEEAVKVVDRCWRNCDATNEANLKSLGNLPDLFKTLKEWGIKTAICTADTRAGTLPALKKLGVDKLVDKIMCSDDHGSQPKPNPHNALRICEELNVSPDRAIMVGDTSADTRLAKNAKLGTAIGVLSGVGSHKDLHEADYLLDSVENILTIAVNGKPPTGGGSNGSRGGHQVIGQRQYSTRSSGMKAGAPEYSYVIIGAGSAGCVLTNRLSENPDTTVLLLEAGPKDYSWKIHMPSALMYNLCDDKYNWYYHTVPQKHMDNREMYWPRGRVWGGSSSLNAMVYIRGHALDYDRWEKEGASGWAYADCLPYFRKAQTHELGGDDYRGGDGPLHVSRGKSNNPLNQAFIEAAQQAGYPYTDDMNGYQQEGFGDMDMTIHKGVRWSTANAYLRPALKRTNVTTEVKCVVTRVLFEGNQAVGVEYIQNGETKQVRAGEVILSGGAINSPQLLMLSGIGDADDLQKLGIPVVQHLPGVGQNLQDHLEVYVQQACTQPVTLYSSLFPHRMLMIGVQWFTMQTGLGATSHLEAGGFIRSRPGVEHPDIQYHFLPSTVNDHGRVAGTQHAYQVHVGSMRPTSRGYLKLRSADPQTHPLLEPNYLSTEQDVLEMRLSIKHSREIFAQKAFDRFRGPEIAPGDGVQSDKDIDAFARKMSDSAYHPSCTCKMGAESDKMAVVNAEARVFGVENLRVVDASIMPSIVSGNLNAPTIMLSEKAADIIKGEPPLPKSTAPVYHPKTLEAQR